MKTILAVFIAIMMIIGIFLCIYGCSSEKEANDIETVKDEDFIVIFLPDGQTIEGLGEICYYGDGYTWVTIDGVRYYTGTNNVLVVRTP